MASSFRGVNLRHLMVGATVAPTPPSSGPSTTSLAPPIRKRVSVLLPVYLRAAVDTWHAAQVELRGQYSLERLARLHDYEKRTPLWRAVLVCVSAPAIAVLLTMLTDAIPLQDPSRGLEYSALTWARAFITLCCIAGPTMLQLRFIIPQLVVSVKEVLAATLLSAAVTVLTQFTLAVLIGYPLPFGLVLGTPMCLAVLIACVWSPRRAQLRASPRLKQQLKEYIQVWLCQIGFTVVYSVYNHVFQRLTYKGQTAFVLLLPIIKLGFKNWISYTLHETDDMKPEVVIFNVDVFHALYVSVCMQSSMSWYTTLAIMGVDVVQAWVSVRDVDDVLRQIYALLEKQALAGAAARPGRRDILETVAAALREDELACAQRVMRIVSFLSPAAAESRAAPGGPVGIARSPARRQAESVVLPGGVLPLGGPSQPMIPARPISTSSAGDAFDGDPSDPPRESTNTDGGCASLRAPATTSADASGLTGPERLALVEHCLHVLFVSEFVVLVKYTEVIVPFIFNACLAGMAWLPNHEFYAVLAGKTEQQLRATWCNVALYGLLELASFVLFCLLLRWKLRFSVLSQVAFVLENQFTMVQSKLVMWVFYVLQTSLLHFSRITSVDTASRPRFV